MPSSFDTWRRKTGDGNKDDKDKDKVNDTLRRKICDRDKDNDKEKDKGRDKTKTKTFRGEKHATKTKWSPCHKSCSQLTGPIVKPNMTRSQ